MVEARHVGRRLKIGAEIEEAHQRLRMSLRLHVAAHERDRHERRGILHDKSGGERVEGTFMRRDGVGALGIEREERAAIMQDEAIAWDRNAGAEERVVAVDPRDHVAVVIGGRQHDGVAAGVRGILLRCNDFLAQSMARRAR